MMRSRIKQEILAMLPVRVIKAKDSSGVWHDVLVDGDYDGEYFSEFKWCVARSGYVHVMQNIKQPDGSYRRTGIYLHHLVLPKRPGLWAHFINDNKFDCRSANLEYQTPSASAAGRKQGKRHQDSGRKYRGVGRQSNTSRGYRWVSKTRWVAYCARQFLGIFASEEEAARAYDKAAYERWGDRATLNFPEEYNDGR